MNHHLRRNMPFHYEPEIKQLNMKWKHTSSLMEKMFKSARTRGKVMMTVFWDMKGHITVDFLEKDTTMNSGRYCEILYSQIWCLFKWKRTDIERFAFSSRQRKAAYCQENSGTNWKCWMGGGSPSILQSRFGTIWLRLVWTTEKSSS